MSVASDELNSRAPAERHVECYLRALSKAGAQCAPYKCAFRRLVYASLDLHVPHRHFGRV